MNHILNKWATYWTNEPHIEQISHILNKYPTYWTNTPHIMINVIQPNFILKVTYWTNKPHIEQLSHILNKWATYWTNKPHIEQIPHILNKYPTDWTNALAYSFHISTYAKFTSTYRVHFMAIAYDFPYNLSVSEIGASTYADDI